MAFSSGRDSFDDNEILDVVPEEVLASLYLGVDRFPASICSPLRRDRNPSFGLRISSGGRVRYKDFATGDSGTMLELLCRMWGTDMEGVKKRVVSDLTEAGPVSTAKIAKVYEGIVKKDRPRTSELRCRVREWRKADVDWWESFGVPLNWLKWAEVYPISHTIFKVGESRYVYVADPLAYVFVEHKEGNTTLKVYQPLNTCGRKWVSKNGGSVIGLWTKVPPTADRICICSSLKDSLCLSANTGIPAVYLQGEGYGISKTAQKSLKERYERIYILFDNDPPGLEDGRRLAETTGFTNLVLPNIDGAKDVSDLYRKLNDKDRFKDIMDSLFNGS